MRARVIRARGDWYPRKISRGSAERPCSTKEEKVGKDHVQEGRPLPPAKENVKGSTVQHSTVRLEGRPPAQRRIEGTATWRRSGPLINYATFLPSPSRIAFPLFPGNASPEGEGRKRRAGLSGGLGLARRCPVDRRRFIQSAVAGGRLCPAARPERPTPP